MTDPEDARIAAFSPADVFAEGLGTQRTLGSADAAAVTTVWVNGRVAGAWTQHKDGRVVYGLFEETGKEIRALIDADCRRIEGFLDGDYLAPRYRTPLITSLT